MIDDLARPPGPQQSQRLLQKLAAPGAVQLQRLALHGLADPGHEAEQESPVAQLVELRERFGEEVGIATERNDVGAETQTARLAGDQREAEQWIGRRGDGKVGEPDSIEAARLDGLGEGPQVSSR